VAPEIDTAARMTFAVARVELDPRTASRLAAGMVARVELISEDNERANAR
jgi:hypothetical protein